MAVTGIKSYCLVLIFIRKIRPIMLYDKTKGYNPDNSHTSDTADNNSDNRVRMGLHIDLLQRVGLQGDRVEGDTMHKQFS